jgi:hypothetical protein
MVNCERIALTKPPVSSHADSMDCIYLGQKVDELLVAGRSGSSLTLAYLVRETSCIRHVVCSSIFPLLVSHEPLIGWPFASCT